MLLIDPFSLNQISPDKQIYAWKEVIPKGPTVLALTWKRKHKGSHVYQHRRKAWSKMSGVRRTWIHLTVDFLPKLPQMDPVLKYHKLSWFTKKQKTKNFYEILYIWIPSSNSLRNKLHRSGKSTHWETAVQ